jgi:transcriptional regulator with XRE-family HTH domain
MRAGGLSLQQIADRLGVSKTRVAEIEKQRTP